MMSFLLAGLAVLSMACCHPLLEMPGQQGVNRVIATIYMSDSGTASIKMGLNDTTRGCATASYAATINSTGWDSLRIDGSHGASAVQGSYCAGFAEGSLSQSRIYDMFRIVYDDWFTSTNAAKAEQVSPSLTRVLLTAAASGSMSLCCRCMGGS